MKERPIIFCGDLVKAILDGKKTVTRRVVKPQPADGQWVDGCHWNLGWAFWQKDERGRKHCTCAGPRCPYGVPGDRLWVRETLHNEDGDWVYAVDHRLLVNEGPAEWQRRAASKGYIPSIFMPRWASRISLEVKDVRVERVQEISEQDAKTEGVMEWWRNSVCPLPDERPAQDLECGTMQAHFACLWDSINLKRGYGWETNPWVWVVTFERITP